MRLPVRLLSVSYFFIFAIFLVNSIASFSQCTSPGFYDLNFSNPSPNPSWVRCISDESTIDPSYTLSIVSPSSLGGYEINFGDGSPIISGGNLPAFTIVDYTYTSLGKFFVTVTNSVAGCTPTTTSGLFINDRSPKPSIDNSLAPITSFCLPRTLTFIGSNINASPFTTYTWGWGDGLLTTTTTLGALAHIYTTPGFTGCGRSITLTAQSLCSTPPLNQPPVTATLGVTYSFWDKDQVAFNSSKTLFCSGDPIDFQDVSIWNCQNTQVRQVRWYSTTPGYSFDLGYKSALPPNRKLTRTFNGSIGTIISVCLIDSNFCGRLTACSTVQIVAPPVSNFTINTPNICLGNPASFSNTSSGSPTLFNVNYGDGTGWKSYSGTNPAPFFYTYSVTGVFTVTGVAARANTKICTDTIRKVVTVFPSPKANFSLGATTACGILNTSVIELSTAASSLIWDFGNTLTTTGSPGVNPTIPTYTLPGVYSISQTAISSIGCTNSKIATVTVFSNIIPDATALGVCFRQATTFIDLSKVEYPDGSSIVFRNWKFGNGGTNSTSNPILYGVYQALGTYTITLTTYTEKCSASKSFQYSPFALPKSNFIASTTFGCNPLNVSLNNISTGASSFIWKYNDGTPSLTTTSLTPLNKTFINYTTNSTIFNVKLVAISEFGCRDSTNTNFTVAPGPLAAFTPDPVQAQCSPANITINNNTIGANQFVWDMGDGTVLSTTGLGSFNYSIKNLKGILTYDTIRVKAISPTGCIGETFKVVPVFPDPGFGIGTTVNQGCNPLSVQFYSTSTAINLKWDFGDGTNSLVGAPSKIFTNTTSVPSSFTVTMNGQSVYGCSQTVTSNIIVNPSPKSNFTFSSGPAGCTPFTSIFSNNSLGTLTSNWTFGDGTATTTIGLNTFNYDYSNSASFNQTYPVKLKVDNVFGCSDSTTQNLTVYPKVTSGFVPSQTTGCSPLTLNLTNVSTNAGTYLWDFGDGTTTSSTNFNKIYTNTTLSAIVYPVKLTAFSANCQDFSIQNITVNPQPKASFTVPDGKLGCAPFEASFSNNSLGTLTSNWTFGDGTATTTIGLNTFNYVYSNSASFNQTFPIKLKVDNVFGCSDSTTQNLTAYPKVTSGFVPSQTIGCSPLTLTLTNVSTNAGAYLWDLGDGTTISSTNFNKIYTNTTLSAIVYPVKLTAFSANCQDFSIQNITVNPQPKASFTVPSGKLGCAPFTASFSNNSLGTLTSNWTFGDGTATTTIGLNTFNYVYSNSASFNQTFPIKLKVDNVFGCSDSTTQNLTVYPKVTSGFVPSQTIGCSPLSLNLTNVSTNAGTYLWDFGDGTTTSSTNFNKIYTNTTLSAIVYPVKLTAFSANCQDFSIQNITVNPQPKASFTVPSGKLGCAPFTASFSNNSLGTLTSNWTFGDGTATTTIGLNTFNYVYSNSASFNQTFPIKLKVDNVFGCSDSTTQNLIVYPKVTSGFVPSQIVGCSPLMLNLTNVSTNAGAYLWDLGDGTTISSTNFNKIYTNTTLSAIVYPVKLTAFSANCQDFSIQNITVNPQPKASFTVPSGKLGCAPFTANFSNNSLGTLTSNWTFGDGTATTTIGLNTFDYVYSNSASFNQTYPLKLKVENVFGCSDSTTQNLTVYPKVTSGFVPSQTIGCSPFTLNLTNISTNAGTYLWDFGDGTTTTSTNFNKIYTNTTLSVILYPIKLTAFSANCQDFSIQNITVNPQPKASFTVPSGKLGCAPFIANFSNNSLGTLTSDWAFGDGSSTTIIGLNTFSYAYSNSASFNQTYPVKLKVDNVFGCSDSTTQNLTVYPKISSGFVPSQTVGCSPLTLNFTNVSTNAGTYLWDFGDETTTSSTNFNKIYTNTTLSAIVYPVKLIAFSANCQDFSIQNITVNPQPKASFSVPSGKLGCAPFTANFSNNSLGTLTSNWTFGDGTSTTTIGLNTFDYVYSNSASFNQTYPVKLNVENVFGCSDSTTQNLTVYPKVTSGFVPSSTIGCSPYTLNLTNISTNAGTYLWDFGDGTTTGSTNFNKIYTNTTLSAIVYPVKLTAFSTNCQDFSIQNITVNPQPKANFTILGSTKECVPFKVQFQNNSLGTITSFWDFENGQMVTSSSNLINYTYTTGGLSFSPKLLVRNEFNCADSTSSLVSTYPKVTARFNMTDSVNCTPLTVGFNNFSIGATSYNWDFGRFGSSSTAYPTKIFTTTSPSEIVAVQLISKSFFGCSDTLVKSVQVNQAPTAKMSIVNNFQCAPFDAIFQNNSINALNSQWDFGDLSQILLSNLTTVNHNFTNTSGSSQIFKVLLTVSNGSSCSNKDSLNVTVYPTIKTSISSDKVNGCSPLVVAFTNSTPGANKFSWDFKDGFSASSPFSSHTFLNNTLNSETKNVQLAAVSEYGCTDTTYQLITVYPKPKAKIASSNNIGCTPLAVQITNSSEGSNSNYWDFGNGFTLNNSNQIVQTFANSSASTTGFQMKLAVQNTFLCNDTSANNITVYPQPTSSLTSNISSGCSPLAVDFSNLSSGNFGNKWLFGDGQIDLNANTSHTFVNVGTVDTLYTTSLMVSNVQNCFDTSSVQIKVLAKPFASFELTPNPTIQGSPVTITNNTKGSWDTYSWDFNDGSISNLKNPLTHVYELDGNYLPTLTVTSSNGCTSNVFKNIQVITIAPVAKITGSGVGCGTVNVSFSNNSLYANSFIWDFGDGSPQLTTNTTSSVSHTFTNSLLLPKTYSITVKASGLGGSSYALLKDSVLVNPVPVADFVISPNDTLYQPDTKITITNLTNISEGTFWNWDFGNGITSNEKNPVNTFIDEGSYLVTMTATSLQGCISESKVSKTVLVVGNLLKMPNAFTPNISGSQGNTVGLGINDVFGPGYITDVSDYSLTVFNKWGIILFESKNPAKGWDGYFNGQLCQEDLYVYKVKARLANGQTKEMTGEITLLHK